MIAVHDIYYHFACKPFNCQQKRLLSSAIFGVTASVIVATQHNPNLTMMHGEYITWISSSGDQRLYHYDRK